MQDLKVVGVDSGSLLLVAEGGERYRITLDELAQAGVRSSRLEAPRENGRRVPPKEIQAHIRAGLSATEVAGVTGADLSYVQRFEGPVIAEREFVVDAARGVPVRSALDTGPLGDTATFGAVITRRLAERRATDERWSAWKQAESPWTVQLAFTADGAERTARWSFDAKRQLLAPTDNEAVVLSHDGDEAPPVPRLRAVDAQHPARRDETRFDSGAFEPVEVEVPRGPRRLDAAPMLESQPFDELPFVDDDSLDADTLDDDSVDAVHAEHPDSETQGSGTQGSGTQGSASSDQTPRATDLLETLRRRRGERRAAPSYDEHADDDERDARRSDAPAAAAPAARDEYVAPAESDDPDEPANTVDGVDELGLTSLDLPLESFSEPVPTMPARTSKRSNSRRGRASMPSWDEIVFGTKPDDSA